MRIEFLKDVQTKGKLVSEKIVGNKIVKLYKHAHCQWKVVLDKNGKVIEFSLN